MIMMKTRITRWLGAAAAGAAIALIPVAASSAGASTTPICTGHCAWEQLGQPSGYDLNVQGQQAVPGTPIIAWKGQVGNPSFDFTVTHLPPPDSTSPSPGYEIVYTPYTNHDGAALAANSSDPTTAHEGTEATNAYASSADGGGPLYCIGVTATAGAHAQLRSCGATGTVFNGVQSPPGGHTLFELSGTNSLSLNDKAYGGNGSPIIAYQTLTGAWNEKFWPGIHNALELATASALHD